MRRSLASALLVATCMPALAMPARAAGWRTITCASAHYSMRIPRAWAVTHGCREQMTLQNPANTIGMVVTNAPLPGWTPAVGRGLVRTFMQHGVAAKMKMTIMKAAVIGERTIAGRRFVQGEEEATDGNAVYIIGMLESARNGREYDFALLLKMTGDGKTDQADTRTSLTVWNSVRLL